jgi:hypothetical protein
MHFQVGFSGVGMKKCAALGPHRAASWQLSFLSPMLSSQRDNVKFGLEYARCTSA